MRRIKKDKQKLFCLLARVINGTIVFLSLVNFMIVGIQINLLQLMLVLALQLSQKPSWRHWIKWLNEQQSNIFCSLFETPIDNYSGVQLDMQPSNESSIKEFQKPKFAIFVLDDNHKNDHLLTRAVLDCLVYLSTYKSMTVNQHKFHPAFAWALWFKNKIFVKRSWLAQELNQLHYYPRAQFCDFAHNFVFWKCQKWEVKSRPLELVESLFMTQTKEFNLALNLLNTNIEMSPDKQARIFNLQIILTDPPTFSDLFNGHQLRADIYCEEVLIPQAVENVVLNSSDESCGLDPIGLFLRTIHRRKNQILEDYERNGLQFPVARNNFQNGPLHVQRRPCPLAVWALGLIILHSTLAHRAYVRSSWFMLTNFIVKIIGDLWLFVKSSCNIIIWNSSNAMTGGGQQKKGHRLKI